MKRVILVFLVTLILLGCDSGKGAIDSDNEEELLGFSIEGQNIWAIYDHAGPLASVDVVMFSIHNQEQSTISMRAISLEHVTGDMDSIGNIVVAQSHRIDSTNCKKCNLQNISVKPNRVIHLEVYFSPVSVEIDYHHNYQALRMTFLYKGDTIFADAVMDIEREESYP